MGAHYNRFGKPTESFIVQGKNKCRSILSLLVAGAGCSDSNLQVIFSKASMVCK